MRRASTPISLHAAMHRPQPMQASQRNRLSAS
jgi:hypothetical protein